MSALLKADWKSALPGSARSQTAIRVTTLATELIRSAGSAGILPALCIADFPVRFKAYLKQISPRADKMSALLKTDWKSALPGSALKVCLAGNQDQMEKQQS
jgi:hypothetical protein